MNRQEAEAMDINRLPISQRTKTALYSQQIKTVGDLIQYTRQNLYRMPNIGKLATREIDDALYDYSIEIRDDPNRTKIEKTGIAKRMEIERALKAKAVAISQGLFVQCTDVNPDLDTVDEHAIDSLTYIVAMLTHTDAKTRERGKKAARNLINLAQEPVCMSDKQTRHPDTNNTKPAPKEKMTDKAWHDRNRDFAERNGYESR